VRSRSRAAIPYAGVLGQLLDFAGLRVGIIAVGGGSCHAGSVAEDEPAAGEAGRGQDGHSDEGEGEWNCGDGAVLVAGVAEQGGGNKYLTSAKIAGRVEPSSVFAGL
jgi:hypothetical protein